MTALPPFDALIAFEATLCHGSLTAAARELGRTQSAISYRLAALIGDLRVRDFVTWLLADAEHSTRP